MEMVRACRPLREDRFNSLSSGLLAGSIIGLPPVLNFGRPEIVAKVVPEILSGKKPICLAITEAFAGSDVAGLKTTAVKTPDGKHWIINGTKK
jgi:alkylation response protein AidB-like acyl-CoA dehydrogenase